MGGRPPDKFVLKRKDKAFLLDVLRNGQTPRKVARRAQILLGRANGQQSIAALEEKVEQDRTTIWRVCKRYEDSGLAAALYDAPRFRAPLRFFPRANAGRLNGWRAKRPSASAGTKRIGCTGAWRGPRPPMWGRSLSARSATSCARRTCIPKGCAAGRRGEVVLYLNDGEHFRPTKRRWLHPCGWAKRIRVILDPGSSHTRGDTATFFEDLAPRVQVLLTPVDGSWLNQAESLLEAFTEHYLLRGRWQDRARMIRHILDNREEHNQPCAHPFAWHRSVRDFQCWLNNTPGLIRCKT